MQYNYYFIVFTFKEADRNKESDYIFLAFILALFFLLDLFTWILPGDLNYHL